MLVALGVRRNYTWSVLVVEADTRWVFAHRYTVILHMRLLRASGTPCGWCAWQVPWAFSSELSMDWQRRYVAC